VCDCAVRVASDGSMCRSAECLVNSGTMDLIPAAKTRSNHTRIANFQANRSLSASLPDLASPSDEFRGLSC